MAFDACMMRAVLSELRGSFPEAKIEKVLQPANDEIDLLIHYGKVQKRLLFNVGPNAPRIQLTDVAKENPLQAPMFCMFLRKRLNGAKIVSVEQPNFDRIARLGISGYDEMGFPTKMSIVCEIMGKYANFILLDGEDKIISALKLVDFAASSVRQILPGLKYTLPDIQNKRSPLDINPDDFYRAISEFPEEKSCEKFITSTYSGVATQIAHELTCRATGGVCTPLCNTDKERLLSVLIWWSELLSSEKYSPTLATDKSGTVRDYSYMDITYLGDSCEYRKYESFLSLFDVYFAERDRLEKIHQRAHDIRTLLNNAISRIERKLSLQRETLKDSERGEEYRRLGDLITANLYQIPKGASSFVAVDYYDESCPSVKIELDSRISASQNAQRNYKLYNKAKTAKAVLTEQISTWERELLYLESVSGFLDNAETEQDIAAIRDELYTSGYASRMKGYKPKVNQRVKPLTMTTSGGFTLLIGRNNIENDRLTMKTADKSDLWFHVKDLPGSHVILVTEGEEPSEQDYTEACEIAAGYSKATGPLVAVDYTRVKNVKKPQGSKPGFVIYKTNYTAFVKPKKKIGD